MMPREDVPGEREAGLELALQLTGVMAGNLAVTTNQLIDNLTAERDELQATLDAVRDLIQTKLEGDFMPTPLAITRALYPSDVVVDQYRPATAS